MKKKVMQHAAVTIGNRIYVIGGSDDEWNYLADVWSAKVGIGCTNIEESHWREEKSLRTESGELYKVTGHAAIPVLLDNGKKYIYVIGGLLSSGNPTNTVLRTEVGDDGSLSSWDSLGAVDDMPGTWLLTAVVSGQYLYVLGGTSSPTAATSLDKVYRARIEGNGDLKWLKSPQDLQYPLHTHATTTSKHGRLYIVGGISNGAYQNRVYFAPLLNFDKSATPDGPVTHGDTLTYAIPYASNGLRDLADLFITDTVPISTQLVSVSSQPITQPISWTRNGTTVTVDGTKPGDLITWDLGPLSITSSGQVSFVVQVVPPELASSGVKQTLAANAQGIHIVLPAWFTADLLEAFTTASDPARYTSALPTDERALPAVRRLGGSSLSLASLETSSVTTTTVAPQCIEPTILSVRPKKLCNDTATRITIEGDDFVRTPRVLLGNTELSNVTFVNDQRITAVVPRGMSPGTRSLTVINPFADDPSDTLPRAVTIYDAAIAVTGVYPLLGVNDRPTPITVTGQNFIPTPTVMLESIALTNVVYLSSTAVTAVIPRGLDPGYYNLTVTNPPSCQRSATLRAAFTMTRGAFFVTGVSPALVCQDERTPITITGANFPSLPFVYMDKQPLQLTAVTSSAINAIVPGLMPTGAYTLSVLGEGPCPDPTDSLNIQAITPGILCWYTRTLTNAITVLKREVIVTDLEPHWALNTAATTVTIKGSGFRPSSQVSLGEHSLSVTWRSDNQLEAIVPPGIAPGTYSLSVSNPPPCEAETHVSFRVVDNSPVVIANVAYLCIEDLGCVASNRVRNPPYRAYLPLVLKRSDRTHW